MRYIYQFAIILAISMLGELLNYSLPFPIPSSIYGLLILLFCLCTKIIKIDSVKEIGDFLLRIMPIMFIPAAVGLMTIWKDIYHILFPIVLISLLTTVLVMSATGKLTQVLLVHKKGDNDEGNNY